MTIKFTIISGDPTAEELAALNQVLVKHKRIEPKPFVKQSTWAKPQLRQQMPQWLEFGAGRNI